MRRRIDPEERREEIMEAALELAEQTHYAMLRMNEVAARAGCSESLVRYYLGPVGLMRIRVLDESIKRKIKRIVEQGKWLGMTTPGGRLRKVYRDQL